MTGYLVLLGHLSSTSCSMILTCLPSNPLFALCTSPSLLSDPSLKVHSSGKCHSRRCNSGLCDTNEWLDPRSDRKHEPTTTCPVRRSTEGARASVGEASTPSDSRTGVKNSPLPEPPLRLEMRPSPRATRRFLALRLTVFPRRLTQDISAHFPCCSSVREQRYCGTPLHELLSFSALCQALPLPMDVRRLPPSLSIASL